MIKNITTFVTTHKKDLLILGLLLLISGIAHGYNMFHYPYYENDEGTYLSRAWSLLDRNEITPYTFWYDHVPGGWMLFAVWIFISGGFFTFGTSVDSGRVFMLILHLAQIILLYYISKKTTKSAIPAIIATAVFSFSPVALFYQRRVLLDTPMIFWVLVSVATLYVDKLRFKHILLSAIAFAFAVLTKEPAVIFFPAYLYILFIRTDKQNRLFSLGSWLFISFSIMSLYGIYAILKGELLPNPANPDAISLLGTIQYQLSRGGDLPFWNPGSALYTSVLDWLKKDHLFTYISIVTPVFAAILSIQKSYMRPFVLLTALYWYFLLRGGLVIDFYLIPLIPLVSLLMGYIIYELLFVLKRIYAPLLPLYTMITFLTFIVSFYIVNTKPYTVDETTPQIKALHWAQENIQSDSIIAIDTALLVDMKSDTNPSGITFPNAHPAWKVEKDPEVYIDLLDNDWQNIEYVMLSHEILKQIKEYEFPLIDKTLDQSELLATWVNENGTTFVDVEKHLSTNGDWAKIYKLPTRDRLALQRSWKYYKDNFIVSYGQVIDPSQNDLTTSEGQSYAMLRALWSNDQLTFDSVWSWTHDHLQFRENDSLISWLWQKKDGEDTYELKDFETASDADLDIALALALAGERWDVPEYKEMAQTMISDIWENEVFVANGAYYLASSTSPERGTNIIVNPSYYSPAHYSIFAQIDPSHPWNQLKDDSYSLLKRMRSIYASPLVPNWILVNLNTGELSSAEAYYPENANTYGFDAFRIGWRVALDYQWFNNPEAKIVLDSLYSFYESEVTQNGSISAVYTLTGTTAVSYSTATTDTAYLVSSIGQSKSVQDEIYNQYTLPLFDTENGSWGDTSNYYEQNWLWLSAGAYLDALVNFYHE